MKIECGFETLSGIMDGKEYEYEKEVVLVDGQRLDPRPSQALVNHIHDGFSWGYGGSGPAQLALAILLHATGEPDVALEYYQAFKWAYVGVWPFGKACQQEIDIPAWLAGQIVYQQTRYPMRK